MMRRERGFTLLEVLIAIGITAVVGLGVWQVLSGIVQARDRVDELAVQFEALQRTMLFLERDITQAVNRPARDIYGDFDYAMTNREADYALMLTRQGWRNPLGIRRSTLQRVGWEYTGDTIRRRYWVSLDQGQEDESRDVLMLQNVTDFQVRFLDDEQTWQENWPGDESMAAQTLGSRPDMGLPSGLEVIIEHERFGLLTRTFILPNFDAEKAQNEINASSGGVGEGEDNAEESAGGNSG
ncbi:type II secretion system minor pseudopilin GspJ [Marinobacter sp. CHS3-4]|uniref:type II secretion system minor pseudopilin GspJ n=1 Tax=Marinobacter sp. CHS3-4 TaxID=3045174 RepID=UPI0024B5FD51|nr:type II secretion system minor pseudopilin GspJ [Marinobacter sp. CHS3-4]MDI9245298.1 type II secretion system minor pseudopilin GspJ [Marinobacter sp. CHS3-4]